MQIDISVLIIGILGSSVFTAIVTGLFSRALTKSQAQKIFQEMWHKELDRMTKRVEDLEQDNNDREVTIEDLKRENKLLKYDLDSFKQKYELQLKENKRLGEKIRSLTKMNNDLAARIRKLEEVD
jgi:predicted RNase H-like nuclease (RuvC/YqgF family)